MKHIISGVIGVIASFFGNFLGSEGFITGPNLVIYVFLLFCLIWVFCIYSLLLIKKHGLPVFQFFYIALLFAISLLGYFLRIYLFSRLGVDLTPLFPLILSVGAGEAAHSSSDGFSASSNSVSIILAENFQHEEEDPVPNNNNNNLPFFPPLGPVDQFRLQNLDTELELFARIRLLENRLIEGLPPQLHLGEYEALVRGFLDQTLSIGHYLTTRNNELFDINVFERKADLVEQLFNLLMGETPDRLNLILAESPFPERAIRTEALEFIVESLNRFRLNDPRSNLDKIALTGTLRHWLQDVQQNGHQSECYLLFVEHFKGSI